MKRKQMCVYIDESIHTRIKMAAAKEKISIKTYVESVLSQDCTKKRIPRIGGRNALVK